MLRNPGCAVLHEHLNRRGPFPHTTTSTASSARPIEMRLWPLNRPAVVADRQSRASTFATNACNTKLHNHGNDGLHLYLPPGHNADGLDGTDHRLQYETAALNERRGPLTNTDWKMITRSRSPPHAGVVTAGSEPIWQRHDPVELSMCPTAVCSDCNATQGCGKQHN